MSVSLVNADRHLCVVCGMWVDIERHRKRPYCLDPDCIEEAAVPVQYATVGVHKSIPTIMRVEDTRGLVGAGRRRA